MKLFKKGSYWIKYCTCGNLLSRINLDDTETMEEMAMHTMEGHEFKCYCGIEYQMGIFPKKPK